MKVYTLINQEVEANVSVDDFIQAIKQIDMNESRFTAQRALSECVQIIQEMPDDIIANIGPETKQRIAELLEAEAKRYRELNW